MRPTRGEYLVAFSHQLVNSSLDKYPELRLPESHMEAVRRVYYYLQKASPGVGRYADDGAFVLYWPHLYRNRRLSELGLRIFSDYRMHNILKDAGKGAFRKCIEKRLAELYGPLRLTNHDVISTYVDSYRKRVSPEQFDKEFSDMQELSNYTLYQYVKPKQEIFARIMCPPKAILELDCVPDHLRYLYQAWVLASMRHRLITDPYFDPTDTGVGFTNNGDLFINWRVLSELPEQIPLLFAPDLRGVAYAPIHDLIYEHKNPSFKRHVQAVNNRKGKRCNTYMRVCKQMGIGFPEVDICTIIDPLVLRDSCLFENDYHRDLMYGKRKSAAAHKIRNAYKHELRKDEKLRDEFEAQIRYAPAEPIEFRAHTYLSESERATLSEGWEPSDIWWFPADHKETLWFTTFGNRLYVSAPSLITKSNPDCSHERNLWESVFDAVNMLQVYASDGSLAEMRKGIFTTYWKRIREDMLQKLLFRLSEKGVFSLPSASKQALEKDKDFWNALIEDGSLSTYEKIRTMSPQRKMKLKQALNEAYWDGLGSVRTGKWESEYRRVLLKHLKPIAHFCIYRRCPDNVNRVFLSEEAAAILKYAVHVTCGLPIDTKIQLQNFLAVFNIPGRPATYLLAWLRCCESIHALPKFKGDVITEKHAVGRDWDLDEDLHLAYTFYCDTRPRFVHMVREKAARALPRRSYASVKRRVNVLDGILKELLPFSTTKRLSLNRKLCPYDAKRVLLLIGCYKAAKRLDVEISKSSPWVRFIVKADKSYLDNLILPKTYKCDYFDPFLSVDVED